MIKVLFALQTMIRGGVEKELITVLKQFDYSKYDVSLLLLYSEDKDIESEIPENVKVINLNIDKDYYCSGVKTLIKKRVQKGHIFEAISILIKRVLNIGTSCLNINFNSLPNIDEEFDIAVCYHIHSPLMLKYVATKINAKKKIGWIHSDFFTSGYQVQKYKNDLSKYAEIVAVSDRVKNEFIHLCPMYSGKVSTAYNVVDENEINSLASFASKESFFMNDHVKILSVGRFSFEKGFDLAIEIAKDLYDRGIDFHWYLIGWGSEESLYLKLIAQYGLEDVFIILGKKTNPYPYIANCDIYVQPSRHEAWGLVVHEARILHKPILVSDFAGSDEQIVNGETGYIFPVADGKAFTDCLSKLILDENDRKRLENNLKVHSTNDEDLKTIMSKFNI